MNDGLHTSLRPVTAAQPSTPLHILLRDISKADPPVVIVEDSYYVVKEYATLDVVKVLSL